MVVKTKSFEAVTVDITVAARRWPHRLHELTDAVLAPCLARPETRATTKDLVTALLCPLARKNRCPLAVQELAVLFPEQGW